VEIVDQTITNWNLKPENFIGVISDSAAYNKKAFRQHIKTFPKYSHVVFIGCLSHIINLMAQVFTFKLKVKQSAPVEQQEEGFTFVHDLLGLLSDFLGHTQSKVQQERALRFESAFHRSSRTLFFIVNTRWMTRLNICRWVSENRDVLLTFLREEVSFDESAGAQTLLDHLEKSSTRLELDIVVGCCAQLEHILTVSQSKTVDDSASIIDELEISLATMKDIACDDRQRLAIVESYMNRRLIIAPQLKVNLDKKLKRCCELVIQKFNAHGLDTVALLKHIAILLPTKLSASRSGDDVPVISPMLRNSGEPIVVQNEWRRLFRSQGLISKFESNFGNNNMTAAQFWLDAKEECPNISNVALRQLALRQGIASVERELKRLRQIQTPERNQLSSDKVEMMFFIQANRAIVDTLRK